MYQAVLWIGFNIFFIAMLVLDLFVLNRRDRAIGIKRALALTAFWISLALLFNVAIYVKLGHDAGLKFLAGYLLEYSLSVDNLFVFLLIFSYFRVPHAYQHKVLFWGIIGAQVMRAAFILTGITLIHRFEWVIYLFGAFLIYTGFKLAFGKDKEFRPDKNPAFKFIQKVIPSTPEDEDGKFFVKKNGRYLATPLFIVLLIVDLADVVFAVDSIPAILAITTNSFIVYTSNMFAILGLRSLYFALAGLMRLFHYLNYGLAFILVFVGVKMLLTDLYKIPIGIALGVIVSILFMSIIASILWPKKDHGHPHHES